MGRRQAKITAQAVIRSNFVEDRSDRMAEEQVRTKENRIYRKLRQLAHDSANADSSVRETKCSPPQLQIAHVKCIVVPKRDRNTVPRLAKAPPLPDIMKKASAAWATERQRNGPEKCIDLEKLSEKRVEATFATVAKRAEKRKIIQLGKKGARTERAAAQGLVLQPSGGLAADRENSAYANN